MFLQQWKAARWELEFHNFSCLSKNPATLTHHTLEGPLEYDRKVYCFHVLIAGSFLNFLVSQPLTHFLEVLWIFSLRNNYRTNATECFLKKLQLQRVYCTVSPRIVLIFSTQLGVIFICTFEFSETSNV